MSSRISTCRDALQFVRAGFPESRRWLLALAAALGLSKCATFVPLILMPSGLGIGRAVWTPPLALLFFCAMAITMALDSLARRRHLAALQSLLHLRLVQTILLVVGGLAVALHRLPENASLCLAIGSCGALLMGSTQACSQLDVARTLARLDPASSDPLICLSLVVTCCALLVYACLPWAWAALLVALVPLAYRPLVRRAQRLAPPGALEGHTWARKRRRPLPATLPHQTNPSELPAINDAADGPVERAEHLLRAARLALQPLALRRSSTVILLAVLVGTLSLLMARGLDKGSGLGPVIAGLAGLVSGLAIGLVATRRLAMTKEPHTRTPMRAARACLPLLAGAAIVAGLAPAAWPVVVLLAVGALVILDQALLVVSLPYLRLDDSEEGRTIATARTSQSVGAAAACGLFCFQTGELHPLPTLFLLISLLLVTFTLCVPIRGPRRRPGDAEDAGGPSGMEAAGGGWDASEIRADLRGPLDRDPHGAPGNETGAKDTEPSVSGRAGKAGGVREPSSNGPLAELSLEQLHEEELARERTFYTLPISLGDLTERQADVYVLAMRGCTIDEICSELGITRSTVNTHLQDIYRAFNVHSRTQLADVTGIILEEGEGLTEMPTLPGAKGKPRRKKSSPKPKTTRRRPLLTSELMEAMANGAGTGASSGDGAAPTGQASGPESAAQAQNEVSELLVAQQASPVGEAVATSTGPAGEAATTQADPAEKAT